MKLFKSSLFKKKILLCVCAGISAYKSIILVRLLIKSGADVKVILSPDAHKFVSPLVLSVLSKIKFFLVLPIMKMNGITMLNMVFGQT